MMWVEPGDEIPPYGDTIVYTEVVISQENGQFGSSRTSTLTTTGGLTTTRTTTEAGAYATEFAQTVISVSSVTEGEATIRQSLTSRIGSYSSTYSVSDGVNPNQSLSLEYTFQDLSILIAISSEDENGVTAGTTTSNEAAFTTKEGTFSESSSSTFTDEQTGTTSSNSFFAAWETATTTITTLFTTWFDTTVEDTVISTTSVVQDSQTIYVTELTTQERPWHQFSLTETEVTVETATSTTSSLSDLRVNFDTVVVALDCDQLYTVRWCGSGTMTYDTTQSSVSTSTYTKWITSNETVETTITISSETYTLITFVPTTTTQEFTRESSVTYSTTSTRNNGYQCTDFTLVSEGSTIFKSEADVTSSEESSESSSSTVSFTTVGGLSLTEVRSAETQYVATFQGLEPVDTCTSTFDIRPCLISEP